jgi:hypothetical protein
MSSNKNANHDALTSIGSNHSTMETIMTSKTIYTLPYVYRLDHQTTNEFYIGYREANKVPSEQDLGFKYFTSAPNVKEKFNEFRITIIAEFFNGEDAYDFEQLYINENWDNPLLLNKQHYCGKKRWKCTGHSVDTKKEMSNTRSGKVQSVEHATNRRASLMNFLDSERSNDYRDLLSKRLTANNPNKGGLAHPNADHTIYEFINIITNDKFIGKRIEFGEYSNITRSKIEGLIEGRKSREGWIIPLLRRS